MLLLLDNLEQLLESAPQLAELSAYCPELVILTTSRAPLRIRSERTVRVEPLGRVECLELFRERATASGGRLTPSTEEVVAEICERLEGLPLAVELAASATAHLRPSALLDRLDSLLADGPRDLPERQRSITATLDWSYDLLGESAQALLAQVAIFPGTFSLTGAEAVAGRDVLHDLRILLDHSLVSRRDDVRSTERFRLLVPVRHYAARRLTEARRAESTARLADAMVQLGQDLSADIRGSALAAALDLAEADIATLRLAFGHLLHAGRPDDAAELVWQLWPALGLRGFAREGLALVDLLRGRPMTDAARVSCLTAAAGMAYVVGDVEAQRADAEAALPLVPNLDRPDLLFEATVLAAAAALFGGDLAAAGAHLASARSRTDQAGPWALVNIQIVEAQVALLSGSLDEAEQVLLSCERGSRALGNPFLLATALNLRATVTQARDDLVETVRLLAESAELSATSRISWTFAYTLPALAGVAVRLGDVEIGARLFGAAASWSAAHSVDTGFPAARAMANRDLATAREVLGAARFRTAWDSGRDTGGADVVELAREVSRRARG